MSELEGCPNPFKGSVVTDMWETTPPDVTSIHSEAFARCLEGIDYVRRTGQSASLVLHGEAGSGKTHLLSRLRTYVESQSVKQGLQIGAVFVYVRSQSSPQMLWRNLHRRVVDDLLRRPVPGKPNGAPSESFSQLEKVFVARLAETRGVQGDWSLWWDELRSTHEDPHKLADRLLAHVEDLEVKLELDRDLTTILLHLLVGRHRRDARAWLRGETLSEDAHRMLGVGSREVDTSEIQEAASRAMVVSLARLSGSRMPLVFCFDQIEALQATSDDNVGFFAFGGMLGTLHDLTKNVFLVTCVQSSFVDRIRDAMREADRNRLDDFGKQLLNPLTQAEATQLVQARLESAPELRSLRKGKPPLWPLDKGDIPTFFADAPVKSARRVLHRCADLFEQRREPIDRKRPPIDDVLQNLWNCRLEDAMERSSPEDSDSILMDGLPLLVGLQPTSLRREPQSSDNLDIVFRGTEGSVGVALGNHRNMRSLQTKLKHLITQIDEESHKRVLVVRDPRLAITKTARMAREHLDALEKRDDVKVLHPAIEIFAALQALRVLLSEARSGELSDSGETIAPKTVEDWLRTHLPETLVELAEEIVEPGGKEAVFEESEIYEDLIEFLSTERVAFLAEVLERMRKPAEVVQQVIEKYPEVFGFVEGPPAILYEYVPPLDR